MMRRYASKFINWHLGLKNFSFSMVGCEAESYYASRNRKCQGFFSGHLNGSLPKAYATYCAKLPEDPQSTNLASDMLIDSFGRMHTYLRISLTERLQSTLSVLYASRGCGAHSQSSIALTG